eukprot:m.388259 g.388259  ORF g.388259 m.388259 type:complete len:872 (+) comp56324_c0_seq1:508-3123(+)
MPGSRRRNSKLKSEGGKRKRQKQKGWLLPGGNAPLRMLSMSVGQHVWCSAQLSPHTSIRVRGLISSSHALHLNRFLSFDCGPLCCCGSLCCCVDDLFVVFWLLCGLIGEADRLMEDEELHYFKKLVKPGHVDVHATDMAIVVHYEAEAVIMDTNYQPILKRRRNTHKIIRIPHLSSSSNLSQEAAAIIERCNLIQPAKQAEVEQLLRYLVARNKTGKKGKGATSTTSAAESDTASLSELETYIELLYEDDSKVKGTGLILQLAQNTDYFDELIGSSRLIGALSRLIKDDIANVDVMSNVLQFFFYFSCYSVFHDVLTENKIGGACVQVISQAIVNFDKFQKMVRAKRKALKAAEISQQAYDDIVSRGREIAFGQEHLLYFAVRLLLNQAEDVATERKMRGKDIVRLLVRMLERENIDLLTASVTFLKKLSIYEENKNDMAVEELDVVQKLVALFKFKNDVLSNVVLRLLMNLSFDGVLRGRMLACGLLQLLPALLKDPSAPQVVIVGLLYQFSIDSAARPLFADGDMLPTLLRMVHETTGNRIGSELIALWINLARNGDIAGKICEHNGLKFLVKRVLKHEDPLLLKMINNLSRHQHVKELFLEEIDGFAQKLTQRPLPANDFLVELLSILANMTFREFNFELLISQCSLLRFISDKLRNPTTEDDLVLETIRLLGTMLVSDEVSALVAQSDVLQVLLDVLHAKQQDDEIVFQIMHVFYRGLCHEATVGLVMRSQAIPFIEDLAMDKSFNVRSVCEKALEIIGERDMTRAEKIRESRFLTHNSKWVEVIQQDDRSHLYDDEEDADDYWEREFQAQYGIAPSSAGSNFERYDDDDEYAAHQYQRGTTRRGQAFDGAFNDIMRANAPLEYEDL